MDLMRKLNKENGQTFVIVTHDPEIGAQCDRIITIRDGLCEDCEAEEIHDAQSSEAPFGDNGHGASAPVGAETVSSAGARRGSR
jgi:ABC-type multidrug transport system ATPase subunit